MQDIVVAVGWNDEPSLRFTGGHRIIQMRVEVSAVFCGISMSSYMNIVVGDSEGMKFLI